MNTKERERFDALRREANELGYDVLAGYKRIGAKKYRGYMIISINANGVVAGGDPFPYDMSMKEVREWIANEKAAVTESYEKFAI